MSKTYFFTKTSLSWTDSDHNDYSKLFLDTPLANIKMGYQSKQKHYKMKCRSLKNDNNLNSSNFWCKEWQYQEEVS